MPVFRLHEEDTTFPHPGLADEDGVIAIGGDLSPRRLIQAYQWGIFPWYSDPQPIIWWSPDPRFVLFPAELKVSKSMRPYFNQQKFRLSYDERFESVIRHCQATPRDGQHGTWITEDMVNAYLRLHELGFAHSVEVWQNDALVGGLYGVCIGKVFFGESMFARVSNASKFGFISLVQRLQRKGFLLIDCQQQTRHLASLGARPIPRTEFLDFLMANRNHKTLRSSWRQP
jgi:leucyl/phenylalanyl-tRNA---protein transferase